MAKGITQEQVNIAIDALIAAGERPTIERVRGFLGTGSPNTLTRMLEVWWENLSSRLAQQQIKVDMPDAPKEVAEAATQLWQLALEQAQNRAVKGLSADKLALDHAQEKLTIERSKLAAQLETHLADVSAAKNAQVLAETRLLDIQRLSEHQADQLKDLQNQRDQLLAANKALSDKQSLLQEQLIIQQKQSVQEKHALEKSHQAMQDRWLSEVDRARQESAKLTTQLQHQERLASKERQTNATHIQQLATKLQKALSAEQALSKKLKALDPKLKKAIKSPSKASK